MSEFTIDYEVLLNSDRKLSIRDTLRGGLRLYGDTIGWLVLFGIVSFVLLFIISLVLLVFQLIPIVGQVIAQVVLMTVMLVLMAGVYKFLGKKYRKEGSFEDFFGGFNYLGQLFIFFLFTMLVELIAFGLTIFLMMKESLNAISTSFNDPFAGLQSSMDMFNGPMVIVSFVVGGLIFMVFIIAFMYTPELIVNSDLSAMVAMGISRKMVGKKIGKILLLMLTMWGIVCLGYIPLFGLLLNGSNSVMFLVFIVAYLLLLFFIFPYCMCVFHVSYEKLFRDNVQDVQAQQVDAFGEPLIEGNSETLFEEVNKPPFE